MKFKFLNKNLLTLLVILPVLGIIPSNLGIITYLEGSTEVVSAFTGNWTILDSNIAPPIRRFTSATYDSESDKILLFGGSNFDLSVVFGDLWSCDIVNNNWTQQTPLGFARSSPGLTYDSESDRVVLFGGVDIVGGVPEHTLNSWNTWTYDLNSDTWENKSPSIQPPPRVAHGMAYDSESDKIIIYGGIEERPGTGLENVFYSDTWAYDVNSNTWTNMNPSTNPSPRGTSMVYDVESDRIILFGGEKGIDYRYSDTWAYDYNTNAWTEQAPSTHPSTRTRFGMMSYDVLSDRVIQYGGVLESNAFDETWIYDYNNDKWTEIVIDPNPLGRYGHCLVYNEQADQTILFSGGDLINDINIEKQDMWALDLQPNRPTAPQNLQTSLSEGILSLNWQSPVSDGGSSIMNYRLYRGTSSGDLSLLTELGTVLEYSDASVTEGSTYYYTVSAVNEASEGSSSNEVSITISVVTTTTETIPKANFFPLVPFILSLLVLIIFRLKREK